MNLAITPLINETAIRYATNGTAPDASFPACEKPIELKSSGVVGARCFDQDKQARGSLWRRQFDHIDAGN